MMLNDTHYSQIQIHSQSFVFCNLYYCLSVSDAAFRIISNRLQVYEYESVFLHCEGLDGSTQLRGIRNTAGFITECDEKVSVLFCTIQRAYRADSGQYWCETKGGERSNSVEITVTGMFKAVKSTRLSH